VADEIAAFANLLMGEGGEGVPVVILRGLDVLGEGSISEVYRSEEEDVIAGRIKDWEQSHLRDNLGGGTIWEMKRE